MKKKTYKQLKKNAWDAFSRWIRQRDCEAYQKNGNCTPCFTCGVITVNDKGLLQAGHFLGGRGNAVLFHEKQVNSQCVRCNIFLRGNPEAYWPKMVRLYGLDQCEQWRIEKRQAHEITYSDLEEIILKYTKLLKESEVK